MKARTTAWQLRNFITAAVSSAAAVALILAIPLLSCRTGPHPQFKPDFGQGGGLANLTIAVSTPEGNPLANAPVYFGGTQFTTDADGRIAIGKVGRGTYEVACDHPDFMYYSAKVDIPVGDYTLDIELARAKGEFAVERILPGLGDATPYQNGTFVIEFNRQLDATSAEASRFEFDPPLGDYTVSVSGSTLTLSFLREWRTGQTVRWKILQGIKSADGGELTISYVGQFRVSPVDLTPPKLVSSTPPDGAVNVFRNQKITLFFSDALDAESLAEGVLTLTPETQISTTVADNSLIITFDGLLAANTAYTLVLASLHDMNGNALQQPVTLKFTTGARTRQFSYRNADWTRIGDRIAFESDEDGGFDIWEIKADGTELRKLTSNSADDLNPRYSYDGSQIVFKRKVGSYRHIFRLNTSSGEELQITSGQYNYDSPVYSPTYERRIAYLSDLGGTWALWSSEEDGSVPREWLPGLGRSVSAPDYHPFLETQIVFSADGGLSRDIFKAIGFPGDADTYYENLTDELASDDNSPCYAPEGDIIAFISGAGGVDNIWLMDFEGRFPRQLTTSEVDLGRPVYSPNFGERLILAEIYGEDGSVSLAFFDAVGGELVRYLVGGET